MKKLIALGIVLFGAMVPPAAASTISFTAPSVVNGSFDVVVTAQHLFDTRDPLDLILSYGFNVTISNPLVLAFLGATQGPLFADPALPIPGTDVFGVAVGQNGFGIEPGVLEPLTLATLHFKTIGPGAGNIVISSNTDPLFQGLQFLEDPVQESIAGTVSVTAVPEPGTLTLLGLGLLGVIGWISPFPRRLARSDS